MMLRLHLKKTAVLLSSKTFHILSILILFLFFLSQNPKLATYQFNVSKVSDYLRSQDILDERDVIKNRITISDSDIYESAGFLYATGSDPTSFNFQHPPFLKYLFGVTTIVFGNPYIIQIAFALGLLYGTYLIGNLSFKNTTSGFIASLLLLFDPVFREVTIYTLLDLGQMSFFIWFLIFYLFYPKKSVVSGVLLGCAMASKFYSPIFLFLGIIWLYKFINSKFDFKREIKILIYAFLVFSATYVISFINEKGLFNIFFLEAKRVKYMFHHDMSKVWGAVRPMFFRGYWLWPISFLSTLYLMIKEKFMTLRFLIYLLPISYLLILTFQTPFSRYFILVLPFLYLGFSEFLIRFFRFTKRR